MKISVNQEKVKRMSRILAIIMSIFYWASIVGVVILAVSVVVIYLLQENKFMTDPNARGSIIFSIDGLIGYKLNSQTAASVSMKPVAQAISVMATIILAGLSIIFRQISRILKTVETDMPFSEENSGRLTIIGFVLIFGSIFFRIAEGIVASAMIHVLNIQNMQVNYSTDGFMMLSGFLILILAGVFKYGNYLQQEYDSTL